MVCGTPLRSTARRCKAFWSLFLANLLFSFILIYLVYSLSILSCFSGGKSRVAAIPLSFDPGVLSVEPLCFRRGVIVRTNGF